MQLKETAFFQEERRRGVVTFPKSSHFDYTCMRNVTTTCYAGMLVCLQCFINISSCFWRDTILTSTESNSRNFAT